MKLTKKFQPQTDSVRPFFFKPTSLLLAASGLFILALPSLAQDSFDSSGSTGSMDAFSSSGATGSQTNNSGHYIGDDATIIQGVNTAGWAQAPMLQGATNGTIGPQQPGTYYAESEEIDAQSIKKVKELIDDDGENNQLWTLLGRLEKQNSNDKAASAAFEKAKEIYWSAPIADNNKDD